MLSLPLLCRLFWLLYMDMKLQAMLPINAFAQGLSIKETVIKMALLSETEAEELLDSIQLTNP